MGRPRIALLGRFTESASALRYQGVVSSRALLDVIWAAGGDPVTVLPGVGAEFEDWVTRLLGFDGVVLPGGGDLDPRRYGGDAGHPSVYDVSEVQDEADLSLVRFCLDSGVPLLAVCRGMHILNVALGGSLVVDMPVHHRHTKRPLSFDARGEQLGLSDAGVDISCYHHQALDRLGDGIRVLATAQDGTVEAIAVDAKAWTAGVQWHPEDTWREDVRQVGVVRRFIAACE